MLNKEQSICYARQWKYITDREGFALPVKITITITSTIVLSKR